VIVKTTSEIYNECERKGFLSKEDKRWVSVDEALDFVCNPTNYELKNGIRVLHREVVFDAADLKVVNG
jgi:hypothetical protein